MPPFQIGIGDSVCSRRFPILTAPNQRHAELLRDALNNRFANQPMLPRFGWLPGNAFPTDEGINIETSIRQAQTGGLTGEAATAIHSIAKEVEAVDETVADVAGLNIVSCGESQPDRFYVFVRLFPGLRVSSPWKGWVVLPDAEVEAVMNSDARKWARENWDQVVAVVRKQSLLRMGTPPDRQDKHSEAVEQMLATIKQGGDRRDLAELPKELKELCEAAEAGDLSEFAPRKGETVDEQQTTVAPVDQDTDDPEDSASGGEPPGKGGRPRRDWLLDAVKEYKEAHADATDKDAMGHVRQKCWKEIEKENRNRGQKEQPALTDDDLVRIVQQARADRNRPERK